MGAKHRYDVEDYRRWFVNGKMIPYETNTRIHTVCLYIEVLSGLDDIVRKDLEGQYIGIDDWSKKIEYDLVFRDQFNENTPATHRYKGRLVQIINTSFNGFDGHVLWFSIRPYFPEGGLAVPTATGLIMLDGTEDGESIIPLFKIKEIVLGRLKDLTNKELSEFVRKHHRLEEE